jgi:D,D-heptose 1,7-bisphosphate phosphatase
LLRQAVILAGGLGTRLGDLTRQTPKPLLPIKGVPFLEYLLWNLKRYGITKILLSVGYLSTEIIKNFGNGKDHGISIDYVIEEKPAGTGGALWLAREKLDEIFLVLNGDTLFDINYFDLILLLEREASQAAVALSHVPDKARFGDIHLDKNRIISFNEKSGTGEGFINGGVYALRREVLEQVSKIPCSLEKDVFPILASEGKIVGKPYQGFFIDIGLPESFQEAGKILPFWKKKPAVFLDRDGVINVDKVYVHRPKDFLWIEGASEGIKWLNDRGYLVIVITNQAGIARGYYSEKEFLEFSNWINEQLQHFGAHIDATYYCPHHPTEGIGKYRRICNCRKPAPGLIKSALEVWDINTQKSIVIGDKESDLKAAEAAGLNKAFFKGGNFLVSVKNLLN